MSEAICKGCFELGSACGKCVKCFDQMRIKAAWQAQEIERLDSERAEQWRMRRDIEAQNDTNKAVIDELLDQLSQLKSRQSGVVLPDALSDAFITCESGNGEYRVLIKSETLKEVQQIHNWLARLNSSAVSAGDSRGHDTKGSRKAMGAMNAKLRAKVGRLERELAALPSIPETSVVVERELFGLLSKVISDSGHLGYVSSETLNLISAILSSKGGDRNE